MRPKLRDVPRTLQQDLEDVFCPFLNNNCEFISCEARVLHIHILTPPETRDGAIAQGQLCPGTVSRSFDLLEPLPK